MGTLIKYEFRSTGRVLSFACVAMIVLVAIGCLGQQFNSDVIITLSGGTALGGLVAGVTGVYVYLLFRFYQSMFGQQAYLTHQIPVRTSTIYAAKMLYMTAWVSLSLLVAVAGALVLARTTVTAEDFAALMHGAKDMFASVGFATQACLVLTVILAVLQPVVLATLVIVLGCSPWFVRMGKVAGVIVAAVVCYVSYLIASLVGLFLVPLVITETGDLAFSWEIIQQAMAGAEIIVLPVGVFIVTAALLAGFVALSVRQLNQRLSLR